MTVEQSPVPVRTPQRTTREDSSSLIYAKVREVTGAPDHVIEEAIKACIGRDGRYKVEDVVTTIISDDTVANSNKTEIQQVLKPKCVTNAEAVPSPATAAVAFTDGADGPNRKSLQYGVPVVSQPTPESNNDFIDLTRDQQSMLGGQISREEQDISRVLEQSLAESKGGTKRKRGELWFIDPLNPHERKRKDGWPVGLKNVGNTCWFSAVIQSLFHLQEFQNLVLAFKGEEGVEDSSKRRNIRFVLELKQLFAMLACSARKYLDPSKAVNILKEDSSAPGSDGQQDVSEFQHKLLDWLEDAFSVPSSPSAASSNSSSSVLSSSTSSSSSSSTSSLSLSCSSGIKVKENPMKRLFLGKYKAEGINEGKVFHQEVTFGQYPLNVLGFRDIHESLEATMAQGEIETLSGNSGQKSGQEIWFTHLPVVLTLELSRFGFNPQLNQAEKIHQQLFFPQVIYMDRYLECNKSCIRQKREEARKLREQLTDLQQKLDKFMNYGSSSKRYPLPDVLQYALDFAQSSPPSSTHHPNDVEMESSPALPTRSETSSAGSTALSSALPCPDVSMSSMGESPSPTPSKQQNGTAGAGNTETAMTTATTVTTTMTPTPQTTPMLSVTSSLPSSSCLGIQAPPAGLIGDGAGDGDCCKKLSTPAKSSSTSQGPPTPFPTSHPSCSNLEPCPREVTELELRVLQHCLRRWRSEVEADVRELQNNISVLEGKLSSLYSDSTMKKYPYHLHAVLVHEGQAVSGHYWSFIYDVNRQGWLKVNDITVSQSSWEEMHRESVGGFHNASAYCLMYVDRSRLKSCNDCEGNRPLTVSEHLAALPADLKVMVENDNTLFLQEMAAWDSKQRSSNDSSTSLDSPPPSKSPNKQRTTATPPPPLTAPGTGDPDLLSWGQQQRPEEVRVDRPKSTVISRLSDLHAQLSLQATIAAVKDAQNVHKLIQPQLVLEKAMTKEHQRLKSLATSHGLLLPLDDLRLTHPVLYLMASTADAKTVELFLSEQFSLCPLLDRICEGVREKAQEHYIRLFQSSSDKGNYKFWHKRYSHYRQAVARFVVGLEAYCNDRHQEALPYFIQAWLHNCEPGLDASNMATGGISPAMLAYFRRSSLQRLNDTTMKMFEGDTDMTDALTIMSHQILPVLAYVLSSNIKEDVHIAEEIREKWCQFLEKDLEVEKVTRLQDFLSKMFEISGVGQENPEPVRPSNLTRDLHYRYIRAMTRMKERGELELCTEES